MDRKIIRCKETSDVKNLVVLKGSLGIYLAVIEADANPAIEVDAVPLITAVLNPSQAIEAARALLVAAGFDVRSGENFINAGRIVA